MKKTETVYYIRVKNPKGVSVMNTVNLQNFIDTVNAVTDSPNLELLEVWTQRQPVCD